MTRAKARALRRVHDSQDREAIVSLNVVLNRVQAYPITIYSAGLVGALTTALMHLQNSMEIRKKCAK